MFCSAIEIEIFEMMKENNKKTLERYTFFLNRGIFIFESLLNPYYLPIAMGG